MSAINPKQFILPGRDWDGTTAPTNERYALGQFDARAYNHGCRVIEEMRNATGIRDGVAQAVVVVVFVDGFLQFAGANACLHNGANVTRDDAKAQAASILERMSGGEVAKGAVRHG